MRYGVNTWVWTSPLTTESAKELIPKVKAMGFDLIELAIEDLSLVDAGEVGRMLKECQLAATLCGAFGPGRDLGSDDSTLVRQGLDYIRGCLEFCPKVEAKVFAGPMYSAVGKARLLAAEERKAEWDRAVRNLRRASEWATEQGVVLGIEPLNRFETDMVNTARQAVEMADAIGHPAARVTLDGFHMNIEESSITEAIKLAGAQLCHIHVSDNDRGTPGVGLTRWDQFKQGLEAISYQGAIVIESFTPGVKEIARAASIWRPLAASQDMLAEDGLRFLRRSL